MQQFNNFSKSIQKLYLNTKQNHEYNKNQIKKLGNINSATFLTRTK